MATSSEKELAKARYIGYSLIDEASSSTGQATSQLTSTVDHIIDRHINSTPGAEKRGQVGVLVKVFVGNDGLALQQEGRNAAPALGKPRPPIETNFPYVKILALRGNAKVRSLAVVEKDYTLVAHACHVLAFENEHNLALVLEKMSPNFTADQLLDGPATAITRSKSFGRLGSLSLSRKSGKAVTAALESSGKEAESGTGKKKLSDAALQLGHELSQFKAPERSELVMNKKPRSISFLDKGQQFMMEDRQTVARSPTGKQTLLIQSDEVSFSDTLTPEDLRCSFGETLKGLRDAYVIGTPRELLML